VDCKIAKNPDVLLAALQEHERVIGQLYQAYSQRFADYADFWEKLAHEENKHAGCLGTLRNQMQENPDIVIVERFSIDAIDFSIRYVKELIERSKQPEFNLTNAFSLAMKLEEALLEKNFFEVLSGDTPDTKETLELLARETQGHYQLLSSTLRAYRASGHEYI